MTVRSPNLPPPLLDALSEVGSDLERGSQVGAALNTALALLNKLPPNKVALVDGAIAAAANLYRRPPRSALQNLFKPRKSDAEQLVQTPGLEYLFLFHRDGRLREAALLKVTGGLPSPFLFAAVLWRLNDWALPVRAAAVRCAGRSFPATNPSVVARAATALLLRQISWRRWDVERAILDHALARGDVSEQLTEQICHDTVGPVASILRYMLRMPSLDCYLEQIAFTAVQPSVRAVALATMINAKAEWPAGFAWEWIDKSMGVRRKVTVFDHRTLSTDVPKDRLIARGIEDRSAVVRRVALTGVYNHLSGTPLARRYAAALLADRSASVRTRAEYILRLETS